MVLLTSIASGENHATFGFIEDGDRVVLGVAHPESIPCVGDCSLELERLRARARHDADNYYYIKESPCPSGDGTSFSLAFSLYIK